MTFRTIQQQAIDRITGGHVMTERDAMLAAILSDPADDLPRLMYADWLDENGESERAEFIRIGVELGRISHEPPCEGDIRAAGGFGIRCTCRVSELRRRERDLTPDVQDCQWCPIVTEIWKRNESEWRGLHTIATWQRGFISSIRLSWADWLKHHEALYWHPKQTVECPACWPDESGEIDTVEKTFGCECCGGSNNPFRRGTGRIPRPFVATAQPITEVELTTWPVWDSSTHHGVLTRFGYLDENGRGVDFTRVKCPACNGVVPRAPDGRRSKCRKCNGQLLNKWTCDRWPMITFKMP